MNCPVRFPHDDSKGRYQRFLSFLGPSLSSAIPRRHQPIGQSPNFYRRIVPPLLILTCFDRQGPRLVLGRIKIKTMNRNTHAKPLGKCYGIGNLKMCDRRPSMTTRQQSALTVYRDRLDALQSMPHRQFTDFLPDLHTNPE